MSGATELSCPGLRVLFVNWRDTGHPEAGGAEVFVDEVARRLAAAGAEVTLFAGRGPSQSASSTRDGVLTVRSGNRWTVYPQALRYLLGHRRDTDLVVDCQNGLPFFSPLVLPRDVVVLLLIHHVHQDQFLAHFPRPLAHLGQWLEGPVSRLAYGRRTVAVVSPSTRTDVRRRLRLRGPIHVVPNGITAAPEHLRSTPTVVRSTRPSIVCVGRLVVHKRLGRLLEALPDVLVHHPDLRVDVVGDGPDRLQLAERARALGLSDVVAFHGRLPAESRDALLSAAWLTVNPSMGEGWGLSVLEAAAVGVPAVAAEVVGLRDAVLPGQTGWLVPEGQSMAPTLTEALSTLADTSVAAAWAGRCRQWAANFTWDRTAARLVELGAAEAARRLRRRDDQRGQSDLVTWAELHVPDRPDFDRRVASLLRGHDLWLAGPDRVWVLCHAADESDLLAISERLGAELVEAHVATRAQLLGDLTRAEGAVPELIRLPPDVVTMPRARPAPEARPDPDLEPSAHPELVLEDRSGPDVVSAAGP